MALIPGTRLDVYEVTNQVGEGGMGQVDRTRDAKLDRVVAINIPPRHSRLTPTANGSATERPTPDHGD